MNSCLKFYEFLFSFDVFTFAVRERIDYTSVYYFTQFSSQEKSVLKDENVVDDDDDDDDDGMLNETLVLCVFKL